MCAPGCTPAPASLGQALAMAHAAVDYLNQADPVALDTQVQAQCLQALERLAAKQAAAQAKVLSAFSSGCGHYADGAYSAQTWLRHHTRVTRGAAGAAVAAARRLAAHPPVAEALAAGALSASWARQICDWTARLPDQHREPADAILVSAAAHGADLDTLAQITAAIYQRVCPDGAAGAAPSDRYVRLGVTFGGTATLDGNLTADAAAAVGAVLDALGGTAGPEDARSRGQRHHDALAEACRRLLASGTLPGRAGGDTRAEVTIGLHHLRSLPGAADIEAAWIAKAAAGGDLPTLTGPAAAATACGASLVPVVTGQVDQQALDELTSIYLTGTNPVGCTTTPASGTTTPAGRTASTPADRTTSTAAGTASTAAGTASTAAGTASRDQLRADLLRWAIAVVSGPDGLASRLRTTLLDGPLAGPSLPLDVGTAGCDVPTHLRRALVARDRGCGFPGCTQPPQVCHPHHIIPRNKGGPTALHNLVLSCAFHHLIVIHTWGWTVTLNPDATITATSPSGRRLHSHSPPAAA